MEEQQTKFKKFEKFHDKYYKHLLLIPLIILLFSFIYLGIFSSNTGAFLYKDISLTGWHLVTIYVEVYSEKIVSILFHALEFSSNLNKDTSFFPNLLSKTHCF